MILGRIGISVDEDFSVTDGTDSLVSGIDSTSFTVHLFNPEDLEVSSSIPVSIIELGHGHYRAKFTPNIIGIWMLAVYHPTYFPYGKTGSIQVFSNDFDSISAVLIRILGLTQENFYMDQNLYNSDGSLVFSRIRIYSDASSVGGSSNVIATYAVEASYTNGQMDSYSVKKQ